MIAIGQSFGSVVRVLSMLAFYIAVLVRIARRYRDDKTIVFGVMTMLIFLAMLTCLRIPGFPFDIVAWLAPPLYLLTLCTLALFARDIVLWMRGAKHRPEKQEYSSGTK